MSPQGAVPEATLATFRRGGAAGRCGRMLPVQKEKPAQHRCWAGCPQTHQNTISNAGERTFGLFEAVLIRLPLSATPHAVLQWNRVSLKRTISNLRIVRKANTRVNDSGIVRKFFQGFALRRRFLRKRAERLQHSRFGLSRAARCRNICEGNFEGGRRSDGEKRGRELRTISV